jgi:hypothetical protein
MALLLGDLGHPTIDARLLAALLLRDGTVGRWLGARGVQLDAVYASFPDSRW